MTTPSAIQDYPIKNITHVPIDQSDAALAQALLDSVNDYQQPLHGRRVWLACSGGRDSLALATVCVQLYQQSQLPFLPQLLHVDHGLQAGSNLWAAHVAAWAEAQGMSCTVLQANVQGDDEQAARQARYAIMRAQMNQHDVLMLAHHADDQAETVLMRLIDGAGVAGLSGMQPWRLQSKHEHTIALWRPWLGVRRPAISSYAKRLQLPYINDPTNVAGNNVRSGLRGDILPQLARFNPNVIANIARSASLHSDAKACLHDQVLEDYQQVRLDALTYPPAQRALDIDKVKALPDYRQRQLLHFWLALDEPLPPAKQLVDDAFTLVQREDNNHQTRLDWYASRRTYRIHRYRHTLYRINDGFLNQLDEAIEPKRLHADDFVNNATITVQANAIYIWQCQVDIAQLQAIFPNVTDLSITPLTRTQKLRIGRSRHPQSGKKLYQSLGIPAWLRGSLVVVSVLFDSGDAQPIALLSPCHQWTLGDHSAIVTQQLCVYE